MVFLDDHLETPGWTQFVPDIDTSRHPVAIYRSCRIGRSTLDNAREALAEYISLLSPASPDDDEASGPDHPVDLEKSLKGTLKLYGRAVDVLRQKRERELLTEALCDMGDLHVSKRGWCWYHSFEE